MLVFLAAFIVLQIVQASVLPEKTLVDLPSPIEALKAAGVENVEELLAQDDVAFVLTRLPKDSLAAHAIERQKRQANGCWICTQNCASGCPPTCKFQCGKK